ncbi:MAG: arginase [Gemmatimonadota bacterium]
MPPPKQHTRIIGAPFDLGASRRGVDMGPSAIRIAGLAERLRNLGLEVDDSRNIQVPPREQIGPRDTDPSDGLAHYLPEITAACVQIAALTREAVLAGEVPVLLGGDHSLSAGSAAGVASAIAGRGQRIGLLWLDAHSDIHTPMTSASGNVHGMPVAHLLGYGDPGLATIAVPGPAVRSANAVLVGLRDVDAPEKENIKQWGVTAFTMSDIDERGIADVMRDALAKAGEGTAGVHVSLDMDFVDPHDAPGVGTPVRGGVTFREAHLAMEMIAASGRLLGLDVVEVNPVLDRENQTAQLAVELVLSALGLRTL